MKSNRDSSGAAPRRRYLRWGLPVLAVVGTSLIVAGWTARSQPKEAGAGDDGGAPDVRPAPVVFCLGMADFDDGVLSLSPSVAGRVTAVQVVENDVVRAGTVLLQLDDEAARDRLAQAGAALEAAEAELTAARKAPRQHELLLRQQKAAATAARHELAAARLLATHKQELARKDLINRTEADAAAEEVRKLEAAVEAAQAKLDALALRDPAEEVRRAEANVRAKRAAQDLARHALREHILRAPTDGMVLRVLTSPGEALGPQPRQPAMLFGPAKQPVVRGQVDQEFVARVAVGQPAEVTDDAVPNGPVWRGRVVRVANWFAQRRTIFPDTPALQDVRTLECIVRLDPGQPQLRIGQRLRVKLFPP